jgi:hypothetical protein
LIEGYSKIAVPSSGMLGGIWLLWSGNVNLTILETSKHYIFARVSNPGGEDWVLGAIYGDASHRENGKIWDKIRSYADEFQTPLCCIGDFNVISTLADKFGGSNVLNSNNKSFRSLMQEANLVDLGYKGPAYTWTNT